MLLVRLVGGERDRARGEQRRETRLSRGGVGARALGLLAQPLAQLAPDAGA